MAKKATRKGFGSKEQEPVEVVVAFSADDGGRVKLRKAFEIVLRVASKAHPPTTREAKPADANDGLTNDETPCQE